MSLLSKVEQLIKSEIDDAHVQVTDLTGTMDHLDILIVSDHFVGKPLIQQHQMIMDILREELKSDLHAVKLKTLTQEKYKQINGDNHK